MNPTAKLLVLVSLAIGLAGCSGDDPDLAGPLSNSDARSSAYLSDGDLVFGPEFSSHGTGDSSDPDGPIPVVSTADENIGVDDDSGEGDIRLDDSASTEQTQPALQPAESQSDEGLSTEADGEAEALRDTQAPVVSADQIGTWRVGPSTHRIGENGGLQQNTSLTSADGAADYLVVLVNTSGFQPENGAYAGSALTLRVTAGDPGLYALVEDSQFVSTLQASPGTNVAALNVIAGTQQSDPVGASAWSSVSGSVWVAIDDNGYRHITSNEPLILRRTSNLGNGVPGAPDQIELELFDIFAIRSE